MLDILMLAIALAFFALSVGYTVACDAALAFVAYAAL